MQSQGSSSRAQWRREEGLVVGYPRGTQRPSCQRPAIPTRTRAWRAATLPVSRSCREGVGQGACWRRGVTRHTPCVWGQLGATAGVREGLRKNCKKA